MSSPKFLIKSSILNRYLTVSGLAVTAAASMLPSVLADATWVGGTSSDYNDAANWSSAPSAPSGNLTINGAGITPVITATPTWVNNDIIVGGGTSGRLDQTAGTLSTGSGNWFLLGFGGATGTYNLANTAGSGGTFTGFGTGSGSMTAARWIVGLDNGTTANVNINTSGTVTVGDNITIGSAGASNGTFNLDNGTVTAGGDFQLGGDQYSQGAGTNVLNMSGGSITANIISLSRGDNNTATMNSTANITGGTLSSNTYFTLGFAGSSSNTSTVNNSGGTINVNTSGTGNLEMGVFDPTTNTFTNNSGNVNLDNNATLLFGAGGNHSGTSTFNHNGGNVTFYSDAGTTVGGTGAINLGTGGDTGTYTYNLNGGTLTTNAIQKTAAGASGTFNFNGGTLKAGKTNATFMTGLTTAAVKSGGAVIDSNGFDITIGQALTDGGGGGGLTKNGSGILTVSGANTYTGLTTINGGSISVAVGGTLGSGNVIVLATAISLTIETGVVDAIPDTTTLSLAGGGTVGLADFGFASLGTGVNEVVNGLILGGIAQGAGTYGSTSSSATFKSDEYFTGDGILTVAAVPEPSEIGFVVVGLLGVVVLVRRRRIQA